MYSTLSPSTSVSLQPQFELLLCCTRTHLDSHTIKRLKTLIQEPIDWACLTQMALRQGVMPLLYFHLNTLCPDAIPPATLEEWSSNFQANALNNLLLTSELVKLLHLFQEKEIRAIPFKGPVLTASVYKNLTLRQFCDLDILVSEQDFFKARDLLLSQGYCSWHELEWQQSFIDQRHRVHIDLHQGITPWYFPCPLNFTELWQRLESVSLAGTTVVNLSPEDLLMILCVQLGRDFWVKREQLIKICDITELIQARPTLNWEHVIEQVNQLGCRRMLFLGLSLARQLWNVALPQDILLQIEADLGVRALASQSCDRLFQSAHISPEVLENSLTVLGENIIFNFQIRERFFDKLLYVLYLFQVAVTPNERDLEFVQLPSHLSFLYYPLKLLRLVSKYGLKLLQKILK